MPYRVGVVGGGLYGSRVLRAFNSCHKAGMIDLSAIADINPGAVKDAVDQYAVAGYSDYREMIDRENLDAVAIVTPDFLHEEIALYCAERKLHMLVQKPLDVTVKGAQRISDAAKENGVLLFVDFHKRFDPSLILLRNKIRDGKLGEILYGYANIEDVITFPAVHFAKWAHNSSPMWFIGIHILDIFNWALGKAPERVVATGVKKKLPSMGVDTYDCIQAKLLYDNGASITLDASWILPETFPSPVNQNVRIVGTEGIMEIDGQHRGVECYSAVEAGVEIDNPYGYLVNDNPFTECALSGYTVDTMLHFPKLLQKLEGGATLGSLAGTYADGPQAVLATRVAVAIHRSADSGGAEVVV